MWFAVAILALYAVGAIVMVGWMHLFPPTPDPSVVVWRIREYLDKGRR